MWIRIFVPTLWHWVVGHPCSVFFTRLLQVPRNSTFRCFAARGFCGRQATGRTCEGQGLNNKEIARKKEKKEMNKKRSQTSLKMFKDHVFKNLIKKKNKQIFKGFPTCIAAKLSYRCRMCVLSLKCKQFGGPRWERDKCGKAVPCPQGELYLRLRRTVGQSKNTRKIALFHQNCKRNSMLLHFERFAWNFIWNLFERKQRHFEMIKS